MLASRLLSVLLLLQTRGVVTASELADKFEVSIRTVYRDIDQLSAAGIPVYAERGRAGGFRLRDGYRTRLTGLTQSEAEALLLAGLPGPASEMGLADPLAAARLKLLAALPGDLQSGAERVASRFHLDPIGWFHATNHPALLPTVARAVWDERYLKISYLRGGKRHARRLGPLGLVLKGGIWYLIAQNGRSFLTYRVSNILDAQVLDERYVRPQDFDLPAYWGKSSRDYELGVYRERADVRLSPQGWDLLDLLGPYVVATAIGTASAPDSQGWIRCTLPVESLEFGVRELMRLGDEVEVLGPDALRRMMAKTLSRISRRYTPGRPTRGPGKA